MRFVGEGAVDSGGPRREFFRLFAEDSQGYFFFGSTSTKFFFADVSAVQVEYFILYTIAFQARDYFHLGRYVAMSICQGGSGLPFFAEPVSVLES